MRILHYTLGLSPYRSGGLTRYATDLMNEQVRQGHKVNLLYPGGVDLKRHTTIKKRTNVKGVQTYEILNPLPVPLYHGVKTPKDFIDDDNSKIYSNFLDLIKPDTFHVHTLMGVSRELLKQAREKHIWIVFTTHDFYGLCLKSTFIDIENKLCPGPLPLRCAWCNQDAKSTQFLRFRNQPIVIWLKNYLHRSYTEKEVGKLMPIDSFANRNKEYGTQLRYYKALLSYMDVFHFNSVVSKDIYMRNLGKVHGMVIPISNFLIRDNRKKGFSCGKTLKMIFVGHTNAFKGFPLLKSVLLELQQYNWRLEVWGGREGIDADTDKIAYKGRYTKGDLKMIYTDCTIAMVPSQCYETFSFVTLEALSYGVPVLVSDHVGAKSIVAEYDSNFIFSSRDDLKAKLMAVMKDRQSLMDFHDKILNLPWKHDIVEHCKELINKLYK